MGRDELQCPLVEALAPAEGQGAVLKSFASLLAGAGGQGRQLKGMKTGGGLMVWVSGL